MRGLTQTAEDVVAEALERFHPSLALACSFQKEETVLLDILLRAEPKARVFTIDTGVLFDETRDTWRAVEQRYGVKVEVYDALSPDGRPWTGPENCCSAQKIAALEQALDGLDAWMTGLRKEQAPTRTDIEPIGWDERNGLWRAAPLADWTEKEIWGYIAEHDLPHNSLHDQGYASIGCAPCTLPGSGREGRWAGSDKTECGLHGDA
ncbi:MAG: phosphoadenylyl-sulfate reductase [Thermoleophilaceae bacterium]|nr:phosphoadenylyl-sulfate reductase [Thermoleophilaceae bacterium]